jgi:hypothetical protein
MGTLLKIERHEGGHALGGGSYVCVGWLWHGLAPE